MVGSPSGLRSRSGGRLRSRSEGSARIVWIASAAGLVTLALTALYCADSRARPAPQAIPTDVAAPAAGSNGEIAARLAAPAASAWFNGRLRKLPSWGDDLRKRIDPAADGWPTEVLAELVEARLSKSLVRALQDESAGAMPFADLFAADFQGATDLLPHELATGFDDGDIQVLRPKAIDAALHPKESLAVEVRRWREALSGARDLDVDLHVHAVRAVEDGRVETGVTLRVYARHGEGGVQQNIEWSAHWHPPKKAGDLALARLSLTRFEEVRAQKTALCDVTAAVLGAEPCFSDEIRRGSGDYHLRQDRLSNQPFLGMHGLAVGDVDGDGLEDLYLPQPGGQPNRLLMHQPDGTARDGAAEAQVDFLDNCGSALILDLDNDGDEDLLVATGPHLLVSWNDGTGHFTSHQVIKAGDDPEITTLCAADPDGDGDLDIYACRYVAGGMIGAAPAPYHNAMNGATNFYYRNEGDHKFVDATAEVGLDVHNDRFTLAAMWHDYDEDGDVDLYVVNDFGRKNLYRNDGGHFTDVAEAAGVTDQAAGMGVDCADVDLDGDDDIYVTNMYTSVGERVAMQPAFLKAHPELRPDYLYHARGNTLLVNRGDGTFEDATVRAGVGPGGWGWGSRFFDLQNDSLPDIYAPDGFVSNTPAQELSSFFWRCVINRTSMAPPPEAEYLDAWEALRHFSLFEGFSYGGYEKNYAYLNLGGVAFADVSAAVGADLLDDTRCAATLDWDDDGRADLVLRNRTGPRLRFLHNVHPAAGHFLALELRGAICNRDAIGARVTLDAGERHLSRSVYSAQGFMCGSSRRLHFGLGPAVQVDRVEVRWPDGARETFGSLAADARYRIVQGEGRVEKLLARTPRGFGSTDCARLVVEPGKIGRILLLDKLPMRAVELPSFAGGDRRISAFDGQVLLVNMAAAEDDLSHAVLEKLGKEAAALERRGVTLVPLIEGEGPAVEKTRARMRDLGLDARAGPADKRFHQALEVMLIEVLGPFDRLPMPLTLLFDRGGQLLVVYCGDLEVRGLMRDASIAGEMDPKARTTEKLSSGRWVARPARDLEAVAQVYDLLGRSDLAQFCREQSKARAPR